jgi:hypothetical protein
MEEHHHRGAFVLLTTILVLLAFYMRPRAYEEPFRGWSGSEDSGSESEGLTA